MELNYGMIWCDECHKKMHSDKANLVGLGEFGCMECQPGKAYFCQECLEKALKMLKGE